MPPPQKNELKLMILGRRIKPQLPTPYHRAQRLTPHILLIRRTLVILGALAELPILLATQQPPIKVFRELQVPTQPIRADPQPSIGPVLFRPPLAVGDLLVGEVLAATMCAGEHGDFQVGGRRVLVVEAGVAR